MANKRLMEWVGTKALPIHNPRVLCPPAAPAREGRCNIVVATPMRSGTHLLIDLLLNNMPAYRVRPLFVDLDACLRERSPGRNLVAEVTSDAGQILKTHLPSVGTPVDAVTDPDVTRLIDDAVVITVRRDRKAVLKSLSVWGWGNSPEALSEFDREWDSFWDFWAGRETLALDFATLIDPIAMRGHLNRLAQLTDTGVSARLRMPLPPRRRRRIYVNKGLTRLFGRHAPRIDTTIHTLKH